MALTRQGGHGLTPASGQAPGSPLLTPHQQEHEENEKSESWNTHGWTYKQLNRESKSSAQKQNKARN